MCRTAVHVLVTSLIAISVAHSSESFFDAFPKHGYIAFNQHESYRFAAGDIAFSSLDSTGTVRCVVFDSTEERGEIVFSLDQRTSLEIWFAATNLLVMAAYLDSSGEDVTGKGQLTICTDSGDLKVFRTPNQNQQVRDFCDAWRKAMLEAVSSNVAASGRTRPPPTHPAPARVTSNNPVVPQEEPPTDSE